MESVKEFCKRTGAKKQRVSIWINEGRLKAKPKKRGWELEENQEKPTPKGRGKAKVTGKAFGVVKQYDTKGNYIKSFESIRQASKELNREGSAISKVLNTASRTAYGYVWKREESLSNVNKSIDK
jgi:ribosomal protein L19E